MEHAVRRRDGQLTPSGAGADFKLSPILAARDYKRYVTSFGNLENKALQGSVHDRAGHVASACGPT